MGERIHRRLPMEFVEEVLAFPDSHRISEREAMGLLSHRKGLLLMGEVSSPFHFWFFASGQFISREL
jgi:hypothetical protein